MSHLIWLRRDCVRSDLICAANFRFSRSKIHYIIAPNWNFNFSTSLYVYKILSISQLSALKYTFLRSRIPCIVYLDVSCNLATDSRSTQPTSITIFHRQRRTRISCRPLHDAPASVRFQRSPRHSNHGWLRILARDAMVDVRRYFELARIPLGARWKSSFSDDLSK